MEYDIDIYSFPLDYEPNGIPLGLWYKGKLSPGSYSIHFEIKWKSVFLFSLLKKLDFSFLS